MSTRTNVLITDGTRKNTIQLYHHCDGYPEGVGVNLIEYMQELNAEKDREKILSNVNELADWICYTCNNKYLDTYQLEDCVMLHQDIEWLYIINVKDRTLTCCECFDDIVTDDALDIVEKKQKDDSCFDIRFYIEFDKCNFVKTVIDSDAIKQYVQEELKKTEKDIDDEDDEDDIDNKDDNYNADVKYINDLLKQI